jgi:arylsulfatase A-like enzyme
VSSLYNRLRVRLRVRFGVGLGWAVALAAGLGWLAACGHREPVRPNVLLVVISGLRADHVSAYGYRRPTTPLIDSMAASGTLYEQAIATAPWGLSSQASILTGLYPSEHLAAFDHPVLEGALETLPEKLKTTGYATFAVSTDGLVGKSNGFFQGIDQAVEVHPEQEGSPDEGAASAEAALLAWLSGRKEPDKNEPFFAYVVLTNPHLPFNPPGEYRQKFLEKQVPLPRLEQISQFWLPFARQYTLGLETLSPDDQGALVALYDGEVGYADYRFGRLMESLRTAKILDDTLVIVTSDAGEDLGDHGLLSESSRLYDSIVRVPLILSLPGRVPAGQRVADQVQTLDIMKAVLALTAMPPSAPGTGPLVPPRSVAICESRYDPAALRYYRSVMPGGDLSLFAGNMLAVRTAEYKYIVTSDNRGALFDLKADPGERASVLAAQTPKARELADRIRLWQATLAKPLATRTGTAVPPASAPSGSPGPHAPAPAKPAPAAKSPSR